MKWKAGCLVIHQDIFNFKPLLLSKYESFSGESLVLIRREICTDQALFTSENSSKQIHGGFWSESTTGDGLFLWICFLKTRNFSLRKTLSDWVVCITCGLFWCFYQLFGLLFWRHPFTAEDPLVSKGCNATFLQIYFDEERNVYILDGLRVSTFWANW